MCALCIVSVAARGPCLRSASPYSFVKCSFECGLVAGGVEGDRWQQQASLFLCLCFFIFLFFYRFPPVSLRPHAVSRWAAFLRVEGF